MNPTLEGDPTAVANSEPSHGGGGRLLTLTRRVTGPIRGQGSFGIVLLASVVLVAAFIVVPVAEITIRSLSAAAREAWSGLLGAAATRTLVANTVWLGLVVASIGTLVGLVMAFVQVRTRLPFKRTLHALTLIPIVSPPFAVAMSIITLFGRSGLITKDLFGLRHDISGFDGLVIALSISFMPIAYLNFVGMLRAIDGSLEEAATDLGGGLLRRLRTIVLPLLAPGIASSFLLVFVSATADLGNAVLLGGSYDVLASRIYLAIVGQFDLDAGAVLSVMLLAPSLLIFSAQYLWLRKREFITVTGRPVGVVRPISQRSFTWPLCTVAVLVGLFITLIYGYIVVGAVTEVWNINFGFTTKHLRYVLEGPGRDALLDTIKLALLSTPIAGLAGIVIGFAISQRKFRGRGLLDFASVMGIAIPGSVIGIGLLLAYNQPTLFGLVPKLSGTAVIILLAFTVRSLPGVVRVSVGAFNQLSPSLEEASIGLGATQTQTFRKIILPLVRPSMFAGLVWAFARSMTSLSPIIFLVTPEWRIMTAQILNDAEQGRYGKAAAYSVVLVVVVMVAIAALSLVTGFGARRGTTGRGATQRGERQ